VAFTDAGIPAGGVFTGADEAKTHEEQLLFGGIEGADLDQCYHQACDNIDNLNLEVFADMKDAAADALFQLANTRNPIVDGGPVKGHGRRRTAFRPGQLPGRHRPALDASAHAAVSPGAFPGPPPRRWGFPGDGADTPLVA
jgi:hypothetical protein